MLRYPGFLNCVKALLALIAMAIGFGFYQSGGIATELKLPEGVQQEQSSIKGVSCEEYSIPARLAPAGWFEFNLVGELCWRGDLKEQLLLILVSGAGYGPVYWDFPYQPETYSYKRSALKAGYATFNYYRGGVGESDHPFGLLLNVDSHAYMLEQIIIYLKNRHAIEINSYRGPFTGFSYCYCSRSTLSGE